MFNPSNFLKSGFGNVEIYNFNLCLWEKLKSSYENSSLLSFNVLQPRISGSLFINNNKPKYISDIFPNLKYDDCGNYDCSFNIVYIIKYLVRK